MLNRLLFRRIDNTPLIIFRIFFGILISLECYGAIVTGWIRRVLVEPDFTFTFIGFEWLQPLPGNGMYFYFFIMGTLGILITLGYRYRWSMIAFTIMWTGVYLMQKSSYNNHYYLLILISFLMCFFPASRSHSLDIRRNPELKTDSIYAYVKWIFVLQLLIVYTYAALAKCYADWLDTTFIELLMSAKKSRPLIGELLQHPIVIHSIRIFGIAFDLLIIPALLWHRTRVFAFICAIFFHLFNSYVFQIGIFPYLALAFTVFFFEAETIRRLFFPRKVAYTLNEIRIPSKHCWMLAAGVIYFTVQLLLPVRHHFFKDDVLWTEEGHRLSWRMMLRSRKGNISFKVVNKANGKSTAISVDDYVTRKQKRMLATHPDFIWQFAQRLKHEYASKGEDVAVYANALVSVNGRPLRRLIDPNTDLAAEKWSHLRHHEWILPSKLKIQRPKTRD
ncbi:HTTM domain-containing protein [Zeaxanthinibacter enoshimensis]|uniref:Vitamin K-dependent gamma-carboxylase-like protein n=1 Tax=Zeaxanthinibacter enoshimensis TaxID=392009 RepID=A0A4R6TLZ0_9FLAO|nr:HTTM domain-containing protein [Zeaxanthinibacter enoshimensis]TDQ32502.1 vitamin K-dependent gamma-carboxylase-like protein [Zeaxanthinibacter enoshimensis]